MCEIEADNVRLTQVSDIYTTIFNRGIKHDFPLINIRKVPREVLKTEGEF